eukprot:gene14132-21654_t
MHATAYMSPMPTYRYQGDGTRDAWVGGIRGRDGHTLVYWKERLGKREVRGKYRPRRIHTKRDTPGAGDHRDGSRADVPLTPKPPAMEAAFLPCISARRRPEVAKQVSQRADELEKKLLASLSAGELRKSRLLGYFKRLDTR